MATIQQLGTELYRLGLLRDLEERFRLAGFAPLAGVDEAGRGCLAGPVVAAAVIPDPRRPLPGVDDSKALAPEVRVRLAERIRATALAWSVAASSPQTIDRINILSATRRAMRQAVAALRPRPALVLVDAVPLPGLGPPCLPLVRGDCVSYAVACASILAKEERDRQMVEMDGSYPHYGFARHKGYAAEEHRRALARYGPCPQHRLTFSSVVPRLEDGRR